MPAEPFRPGRQPTPESGRIENYSAYVALCCGIASLVPWVFVLMFPLALVFGAFGMLRAQRLPKREGRAAAAIGMGVALTAAVLHFALVGLGALIGFVEC